MPEYFDVNVARDAQQRTLESAATRELDSVFKTISEAVNCPTNTTNCTHYYARISDAAVKRLEKLGYRVSQRCDGRNEVTATITW